MHAHLCSTHWLTGRRVAKKHRFCPEPYRFSFKPDSPNALDISLCGVSTMHTPAVSRQARAA